MNTQMSSLLEELRSVEDQLRLTNLALRNVSKECFANGSLHADTLRFVRQLTHDPTEVYNEDLLTLLDKRKIVWEELEAETRFSRLFEKAQDPASHRW